jgi:tripartite-type tricarboxylate transporter receptor subunit TctC
MLSASAMADPVADFYANKTVNLYIGYSAGGGYDIYARLLARHYGKQIPGKPSVVPQNMPGAGSLKVATYLNSVAARDGTAIATFARGMPIYPILFTPEFDGNKFGYIGSITTDTSVCITWHNSPIAKWADVLEKPSAFGGEGKGSDPDMFATMLQEVFKAKVKLISGYPGTKDITLAMERRELDGLCGISMSTIRSAHADWLQQKKINIIVQAALEKDPTIMDVPSMLDLAKTPADKQLLTLAVAPQTMARPFATTPDVPPERLKALQAAFDQTMKDPDFLADAGKLRLDVNPVSGPAIAEIVRKLYDTPKNVVEATAKAVGAK